MWSPALDSSCYIEHFLVSLLLFALVNVSLFFAHISIPLPFSFPPFFTQIMWVHY